MPVLVDKGLGSCHLLAGPTADVQSVSPPLHPAGAEWIEIGLVNNMPETAHAATEQQFLRLLGTAAGDRRVRLRFFALPSNSFGEVTQSYLNACCSQLGDVRKANLDGLIVTGTEPKAARLTDEPFWEAFTQLVDWAKRNTISSIWSCLACHAAVLHLDGVARCALPEKCFGVFDCEKVAEHPLTTHLPSRLFIPHARWNEVREADLAAAGYDMLTRSSEAGVDAFIRQDHSLLLFFQGHPEYDASAIFNEFRRDVGRYLRGEREHYPGMPQNYFDAQTEATLAAFRDRASARPCQQLLAEFPVLAPAMPMGTEGGAWHPFAAGIYRNWLTYLSAQKLRQRPTQHLATLSLAKDPRTPFD